MACEGVYADVRRDEKTQEETENKEEVVDKEKFLWMLKMYREFKTEYVRILRFNSSASVAPFGKNASLAPFIYIKSVAQRGNILLFLKGTFPLSSPRAERARAVTVSQCPHSEVGQDFLLRRRVTLTETAVTRKRKV